MIATSNKRRVRGWILQLLMQEPVGADGLRGQVTVEKLQERLFEVRHELSVDEVKAECSYLAGKGLVEMERFEGTAGKLLGGLRTGVRINAAGIDIAEETTKDPGIDLGVFSQRA